MRRRFLLPLVALVAAGCSRGTDHGVLDAGTDTGPVDAGYDSFRPPVDLGPLDPDAACASSMAPAVVVRKPVDIIFVVDNSSSMQPAIDEVQMGLDAFTALIAAGDLDYRVIVVSKRGHGAFTSGGSTRYAVCVPPPLSSDTNCADGPRFFQESLDVRSTQGFEQVMGALDETVGYRTAETYGADLGETSWGMRLRPEASKTFVMVTDDNERMVTATFARPPSGDSDPTASPTGTVDWFEHMPMALNPFNGTGATSTRTLPVGLLDASRAGMFDGYKFDAVYGWGSTTDDTVRCTYPAGGSPSSSGRTYTAWVDHTHGVRAQICPGHSAWTTFFTDVATSVVTSSHIDCTIALPTPPDGSMLDPTRINVQVQGMSGTTVLHKAASMAACGTAQAWYYDNDAMPTQVILCPAACDYAQAELTAAGSGVAVQFGCMSLLI